MASSEYSRIPKLSLYLHLRRLGPVEDLHILGLWLNQQPLHSRQEGTLTIDTVARKTSIA